MSKEEKEEIRIRRGAELVIKKKKKIDEGEESYRKKKGLKCKIYTLICIIIDIN